MGENVEAALRSLFTDYRVHTQGGFEAMVAACPALLQGTWLTTEATSALFRATVPQGRATFPHFVRMVSGMAKLAFPDLSPAKALNALLARHVLALPVAADPSSTYIQAQLMRVYAAACTVPGGVDVASFGRLLEQCKGLVDGVKVTSAAVEGAFAGVVPPSGLASAAEFSQALAVVAAARFPDEDTRNALSLLAVRYLFAFKLQQGETPQPKTAVVPSEPALSPALTAAERAQLQQKELSEDFYHCIKKLVVWALVVLPLFAVCVLLVVHPVSYDMVQSAMERSVVRSSARADAERARVVEQLRAIHGEDIEFGFADATPTHAPPPPPETPAPTPTATPRVELDVEAASAAVKGVDGEVLMGLLQPALLGAPQEAGLRTVVEAVLVSPYAPHAVFEAAMAFAHAATGGQGNTSALTAVAVEMLERRVAIGGGNGEELWYTRVKLGELTQDSNPDAALQWFRSAFALDSARPEPLYYQARLRRQAGDAVGALGLLQSAAVLRVPDRALFSWFQLYDCLLPAEFVSCAAEVLPDDISTLKLARRFGKEAVDSCDDLHGDVKWQAEVAVGLVKKALKAKRTASKLATAAPTPTPTPTSTPTPEPSEEQRPHKPPKRRRPKPLLGTKAAKQYLEGIEVDKRQA